MADALADWLRLREQADAAARSERLTRAVAGRLPGGEVRILDLASGTGSNIRYLAPRLGRQRQRWLAVDRSATLLSELRERAPGGAPGVDWRIDTRELDLGALDDETIFTGRHLVTASALLDLVSPEWLRTLAARCHAAGASALFTITYDGRSSCAPAEPEDDLVRELMNRHQHTDKGLGGAAAGPDAADAAEHAFASAGFHVERQPSDWRLPPAARELQRQLIDGWAEAAAEIAPEWGSTISDWLSRRLAHLDAGRSRIVVGHEDLAAWLP